MTTWRTNTNTSSREFFQVSLVTYLLLTLAEALKEGFVSNFFNMNYLLLVVLLAGVAMVLTEPAESEIKRTMEVVHQAVRARLVRPAVDSVRRAGRFRTIDLREQPSRKIPTSRHR
ncbi:MAG: hypothetical protein JWN01_603 [Patescibacteria group bacterium]|jgi:hypothetical protein|nr:hypothetical protein [Patescibacteria group bacterium]